VWVRVLGSAAGGGFPQWNCNCPCCQAVRTGSRPCQPRTQSSVAVSPDYRRWFVFNASPDIRCQLLSFPALHPSGTRTSPLQAVLLTDAELDHTLGLLLLREAEHMTIYATEAIHAVLENGTAVLRTLKAYTHVEWHTVIPGQLFALTEHLSCVAFAIPLDKAPRFPTAATMEATIGYRITDHFTGGTLVYAPGVQVITPQVLAAIEGCSCLLFDGTFWRDDEMIQLGVGTKTARQMGHVPISGPGGSLEHLAPLPIPRKIYIHINNTNPILLEDTLERQIVKEHGFEVAVDGLELEI